MDLGGVGGTPAPSGAANMNTAMGMNKSYLNRGGGRGGGNQNQNEFSSPGKQSDVTDVSTFKDAQLAAAGGGTIMTTSTGDMVSTGTGDERLGITKEELEEYFKNIFDETRFFKLVDEKKAQDTNVDYGEFKQYVTDLSDESLFRMTEHVYNSLTDGEAGVDIKAIENQIDTPDVEGINLNAFIEAFVGDDSFDIEALSEHYYAGRKPSAIERMFDPTWTTMKKSLKDADQEEMDGFKHRMER